MADTGKQQRQREGDDKFLHVRLTPNQHKDLKLRAVHQDKSMSDYVRDALFGKERTTIHA